MWGTAQEILGPKTQILSAWPKPGATHSELVTFLLRFPQGCTL